MTLQPVLFQIRFYKGLGEPQENTLGKPLAFLKIELTNFVSFWSLYISEVCKFLLARKI